MSFEDLNKNESSDDLKRLKDSFDSLISDLRSIVPEISEKRKSLRDEQAAEIDRIYAAQRNLDFKKEFVDPDPIAHVEKFVESGDKNKPAELHALPEIDLNKKSEILDLLGRVLALKEKAIKLLDEARKRDSKDDILARSKFLEEIEIETKAVENMLKAHTGARNAKFLDNIVKDVNSRQEGK